MKLFLFLIVLIFSEGLFSQIIINKKTEFFINLEVNKNDLWIFCNKESNNKVRWFSIRVAEKDHAYLFFHRHLLTVKQCRDEEKKYSKMIEKVSRIRLLGTVLTEEIPTKKEIIGVPKRFTDVKLVTSAYFESLEVVKF